MISNLLFICSIIGVTVADQHKHKTDAVGKKINIALETVLEFNNKNNADIQMLNNVEKLISNVRTAINKNGMLQQAVNHGSRYTFVNFIQTATEILNKYSDRDLKYFFSIVSDEIRKHHHKGSKFHELIENSDTKSLLDHNLNVIVNKPVSSLRIALKMISVKIKEKKYSKKEKELVELINSLYEQDSNVKYHKFLQNIDDYRLNKTSDADLKNNIKESIRSLIFDHYAQLNKDVRKVLKAKIGDFWNHRMEIHRSITAPTDKTIFRTHRPPTYVRAYNALRTSRQMYVDKSMDFKYSKIYEKMTTKTGNNFKIDSIDSNHLLILNTTTRKITNRDNVPSTKHYKLNKSFGSSFKKYEQKNFRHKIKPPITMRTFRKMYKQKAMSFEQNPYADNHLSTQTNNKNTLTFWTLYPTFDRDRWPIDSKVSQHIFNLPDPTKRRNINDKIHDKPYSGNIKIIKSKSKTPKTQQFRQRNSQEVNILGLPEPKRINKEQKRTYVKQSQKYLTMNKEIKKYETKSLIPILSLKVPVKYVTEILPKLKQISRVYKIKEKKISTIRYSHKLARKSMTLSTNIIKRRYVTAKARGSDSYEGLSIEGIEESPKKYHRRKFVYVHPFTSVTAAINHNVLTKLKTLENEIYDIKNRLENETETIKYLHNKLWIRKHMNNNHDDSRPMPKGQMSSNKTQFNFNSDELTTWRTNHIENIKQNKKINKNKIIDVKDKHKHYSNKIKYLKNFDGIKNNFHLRNNLNNQQWHDDLRNNINMADARFIIQGRKFHNTRKIKYYDSVQDLRKSNSLNDLNSIKDKTNITADSYKNISNESFGGPKFTININELPSIINYANLSTIGIYNFSNHYSNSEAVTYITQKAKNSTTMAVYSGESLTNNNSFKMILLHKPNITLYSNDAIRPAKNLTDIISFRANTLAANTSIENIVYNETDITNIIPKENIILAAGLTPTIQRNYLNDSYIDIIHNNDIKTHSNSDTIEVTILPTKKSNTSTSDMAYVFTNASILYITDVEKKYRDIKLVDTDSMSNKTPQIRDDVPMENKILRQGAEINTKSSGTDEVTITVPFALPKNYSTESIAIV